MAAKKSTDKSAKPAAPASPFAVPAPGTPEYYGHRILQARSRLLMKRPFYGYLAMMLPNRLDEKIKTAATNGHEIIWSPAFIDKIDEDEMLFTMAHEILHNVLGHMWRANGRDHQLWNVATDSVINDMLLEDGFKRYDDAIYGAKGKSAEEVYDELMKQAKQGKRPQGDSLDDHGSWYNKDPNSVEDRTARDRFSAGVKDAMRNGYGTQSQALKDALTDIDKAEKVDWRVLLLSVLTYQQDDYTWTPVDRRLLRSGILLPTLRSEEIKVMVVMDTSGSVPTDLLAQFWAETSSILKMNGIKARILTCDTEIGDEWTESEFNPKSATVKNRGGTSFVKPFERLAELANEGWQATLIVYMTDLDGAFPTHAPFNVRVVWAVPADDSKKVPPFGEVLAID